MSIGKIETFVHDAITLLETNFVFVASRIAPIIAPIPTAFAVARAVENVLCYPRPIAVIAGIAVEMVGIGAGDIALRLFSYNRSRKSSQPAAPIGIAAAVLGLYFVIAISLAVVIEFFSGIAKASAVLLVFLSLDAIGVLALNADHKARILANKEAKDAKEAHKKLSESFQKVSETFHEVSETSSPKPKRTKTSFYWRLTDDERELIKNLTIEQIVSEFDVSRETARNWKKYSETGKEKK